MEKNNEKRLDFVRSLWHKPLIMTKLCILFLMCSLTAFTAGAIGPDDEGTVQQAFLTGKVTDVATGEALVVSWPCSETSRFFRGLSARFGERH